MSLLCFNGVVRICRVLSREKEMQEELQALNCADFCAISGCEEGEETQKKEKRLVGGSKV